MTAIDERAGMAGRIEDDVVDCSLGNGRALLNVGTGRYFSLGETGAFVWEALKRDASLEAIADGMAREFDVPLDRSRADLESFMEQLEEARLIRAEIRPEPGSARG